MLFVCKANICAHAIKGISNSMSFVEVDRYNVGEIIFRYLTLVIQCENVQGSHRLERHLNIQDCLENSLKIKSALKST